MEKNFSHNKVLEKFLKYVDENNLIQLPFVSEVVSEAFPFIQSGVKQDIIDKSIEQGNCVHDMIDRSIKNKNQEKLILVKNECKNGQHISYAVKIISALNSFIYKHKIKFILSENSFINFDKFHYIGTPDIILGNDTDWFVIDIKTSRINFLEKSAAQLFLYKKMLESTYEIKISETYILNPREEITMLKVDEPDMKTKRRLYEIINHVK
jgi:hypothetical protein